MHSMPRAPRPASRGCRALALVALPVLATGGELSDMTLEELGRITVTSVSRGPQPLNEAPAAIFVITHDDIVRSGATTLADAMRLAPNLSITQLGSSNFSAATRGFGTRVDTQSFSNKLLVLIDGRSVYSPLYSGVYLDTQDVPLEDIDRIEVISGPGATLWGANAVNGVINVITRPSYLTTGTTVAAAAGNVEHRVLAQYGSGADDDFSYRAYGKAFERGAMRLADGSSAVDGWHRAQAGFRIDVAHDGGAVVVQGDAYRGTNDRAGPGSQDVDGANLLARWEGKVGGSHLRLQGYADHVGAKAPAGGTALRQNTLDLEAQQSFELGWRQQIVWGAGARVHRYHISDTPSFLFDPSRRTLQIWNLFAQDTIEVVDSLKLTLGVKFEHNSFTGWEPQPDLRIAWRATASTLLWGAASRAVRSPTPFDTDVIERLGGADYLVGNKDFRSEKVMAYEAGVRTNVSRSLSLSVSAFYNEYDDLRTIEPSGTPEFIPLHWDNLMEGHSFGASTWATLQMGQWWRLTPGVALLEKRLRQKPSASALLDTGQSGNDPSAHALLNSSMDIGPTRLDFTLRHVAKLPDPALHAYTELTARLAWQASPSLEVSVAGNNLLHARHEEYPTPEGEMIRRSVLLEARWSP
jgi:iron complex outermembrane receptor protein